MFKNDKYKRARGNYSRLLSISCADCGTLICTYQKDGPGILKRMYVDRITNSIFAEQSCSSSQELKQFECPNCRQLMGVPIEYKKEDRLAYRLFTGAVQKKIVKSTV